MCGLMGSGASDGASDGIRNTLLIKVGFMIDTLNRSGKGLPVIQIMLSCGDRSSYLDILLLVLLNVIVRSPVWWWASSALSIATTHSAAEPR